MNQGEVRGSDVASATSIEAYQAAIVTHVQFSEWGRFDESPISPSRDAAINLGDQPRWPLRWTLTSTVQIRRSGQYDHTQRSAPCAAVTADATNSSMTSYAAAIVVELDLIRSGPGGSGIQATWLKLSDKSDNREDHHCSIGAF